MELSINFSDHIFCRLGEHIEIRPGPTSNTTSFFLLLSSGGLIVYLLYKSLNDENQSGVQHQPPQLTDTVRFDEFSVRNTLYYFHFLKIPLKKKVFFPRVRYLYSQFFQADDSFVVVNIHFLLRNLAGS